VLSVEEDGPGLVLADTAGTTRVLLSTAKAGPVLGLAEENGKHRAALAADKSGPALHLSDENDKIRAGLGVAKTTRPDGRTTICPESSLFLSGPHGKVILQAP